MKNLKILRGITAVLVIFSFFTFGAFVYFEYIKLVTAPINSWGPEAPIADCGVVLTGGPNRISEGFDLLSRQQIRTLVISGVNPSSQIKQIFPQWVAYPNVDIHSVILEKRSNTTYGNAQQSWPIVEALSCRVVLLITSQLHMNRALKTFRAAIPPEVQIIPHSVNSGVIPPSTSEVLTELSKSLFYFFWAY